MEGKHKYLISLVGDGIAEGVVEMTDEEYQILRRVFNRKNWEDAHIEPYSPSLYISREG